MSDEPASPPPPPPPPPPYLPPGYESYPPLPPPQPGPPMSGMPGRSPVPVLLSAVVALALVGAGVALAFQGSGDDVATGQGAAGGRRESSVDLSDVVTFTTLRRDHVTESVDYDSLPPAGGKHFAVWLDCGVYDQPVRDEYVVHDLEHGAFWFAYDAAAVDDDEVAALAARLPENGVMTPYEGLDAPVVVTVWENQLALDGVDDPRLPLFLEAFAGGVTAPEPFASCAGGATPADIAELALPTDVRTG